MPEQIVILVLVVGGFVAFLIYKSVAAARERKEEKRRRLRALGFEPVANPPAEVAEPILALHQHGKARQHKISELFERRGSADRLYLFDLESTSGEGGHEGAIAVFSPHLRIPRLAIFPRLEGEGRLAALGNLVLKKLAGRHGTAVDFGSSSRFARRHFVSGPDEGAIRRFLNGDRLDRLAAMDHMAVAGEGGLFTYQRVQIGRRKSRARHTDVAESVQRAEELLRVLRG